jgi:hypothetical protein
MFVRPWYEGGVSPPPTANLSLAWISKDRVSVADRLKLLISRQGSGGSASSHQEGRRRSISMQERKADIKDQRRRQTAGLVSLRSALQPSTATDMFLSKSFVSASKSTPVTPSIPELTPLPVLAMLGNRARPYTAGVEVTMVSNLGGHNTASRPGSKGLAESALYRFRTPEGITLPFRTSVSAGGNRLPQAFKPRIVNKSST